MNERIRELANQATKYADDNAQQWNWNPGPSWDELFEVKFAELIVGECLFKIETEAAQYAEPVWAFELVNDIKEHFGVE